MNHQPAQYVSLGRHLNVLGASLNIALVSTCSLAIFDHVSAIEYHLV